MIREEFIDSLQDTKVYVNGINVPIESNEKLLGTTNSPK